jgi:hypothetical protein
MKKIVLVTFLVVFSLSCVGAQISEPPCKLRGDYNGDGRVNLVDVVLFAKYMFGEGDVPAPVHPDVMDVDGNGTVTVADFVYFLNYMFYGGPKPVSC